MHGALWRCYADCDCSGTVADPDSSALGAAMTVMGLVRHPDRASLAATLDPEPGDAPEARRARISRAAGSAPDIAVIDQAVVSSAYLDIADPPVPEPEIPESRVAELGAVLATTEGRGRALEIALTPQAEVAERLWTRLTRALPAPYRAGPAALVAVHAYLRGDGTLARIAVTAALEADGDHPLARLLSTALGQAMPPEELRRIMTEAVDRSAGWSG
nr:DUF4192 domain-containing protein [Actinokineospora pegani]